MGSTPQRRTHLRKGSLGRRQSPVSGTIDFAAVALWLGLGALLLVAAGQDTPRQQLMLGGSSGLSRIEHWEITRPGGCLWLHHRCGLGHH